MPDAFEERRVGEKEALGADVGKDLPSARQTPGCMGAYSRKW